MDNLDGDGDRLSCNVRGASSRAPIDETFLTLFLERLRDLGPTALGGALAGALVGSAEALRVVAGGALGLDRWGVGALLVAGTVSGALLGATSAPVALVPVGASTRSAWRGFVGGLAVTALAAMGVTWFTDPPPFQEAFFLQGNPLAFAALASLVGGAALAVQHAARSPRSAATIALVTATGLGGWVVSGRTVAAAPTAPTPEHAPNVLLVTLDTVRADRFGAYGADVDTRAFDSVAREGVRWANAMAVAPVTGPSHASMFSGSGPWDHGVLLNGVPLPTDRPLLAEVLRAHGWRTGAFVSAYVLDGGLGFRRGFEVYDDDFAWPKGGGRLLGPRLFAMLGRRWAPETVLERRGGDTVDAALGWLGQRRVGAEAAPWMMWVHLFDAHGPYTPPPPWDTRYAHGDATDPADTSLSGIRDLPAYMRASLEGITSAAWVKGRYEGEISYADTQLGRLLAAVDQRGETGRTLVAVMGDHGESLGEHGAWFTHGDDVHEASVRVPFAMRLPGTLAAGTVVTQPVEGSDLAPTLLSVVGIDPPSTMTGHDARAARDAGYARSMCFDRAANRAERAAGRLHAPRWRLASTRGAGLRAVVVEHDDTSSLWDLARDPGGETPLAALPDAAPTALPATSAADSQALLDGARALLRTDATVRSGAAQISDEERAKLEALGYLDPLAPSATAP